MKNLKVRMKLVISFSIVILLLIISMVISIQSMKNLSTKVEYYASAALPVVNSMWQGRNAMTAAERSLYKAMSTDDPVLTQNNLDEATAQLDILKNVVGTLRESYSGNQEDVEKFFNLMNSTVDSRERICALLAVNNNEAGLVIMEKEYLPVFTEAENLLTEMANGVQGRVDQYSADAQRSANMALILLIVTTIFNTIVAVIVCLWITRSIRKPIEEIQGAAKKLAGGDFSVQITYESKDELGELAGDVRTLVSTFVGLIKDVSYGLHSIGGGDFTIESKTPELYIGDFLQLRDGLNEVINNLCGTLHQINLASDQVADGSQQVSSGAQALSQGATEQASAVQELAATIGEISNQINANAENAVQASKRADEVGVEAMDSNQRMQSMLSAMSDISNSSSEIGKIIKTIEDIAFQTNILALNAAVEAARAGSAGKGFAVVADEVRNLASKSAEASKHTSELIENSMKAVENGTKIADETAQSLNVVVEGVNDVAAIINKISAASKEQADSVSQVTTGVDQISGVVQTNSATAEESAATSEELSGQAETLKSLVGQFNLV